MKTITPATLGLTMLFIAFGGTRDLSAQATKTVRAAIVVPERTPLEEESGVTWVLAVAVEKYKKVTPLAYTGEDASAFVRAFREVGQDSPSRLHLIAPGEAGARGLDTDSTTIKQAILRVAGFAQPRDTFIFYFSGHGYRDGDNRMYLATNDFDLANPEGTSIPVDFVKDALSNCRAANQLVFLDACHSGAFSARSMVDGRALANSIAEKAGVAVITSCTGGQVSLESAELKHGLFTYWLVKGLRGQANSTIDAKIDIQEVFRFVSGRVSVEAARINRTKQTPAFAAQNLTAVTKVIDLKRPDRPSVLVAAKNDVPVGDVGYDPALIEAMAYVASVDPVLVIGRLKWIMENDKPSSASYKAADRALQDIDKKILKGTIRLPKSVTGDSSN